MSVVDQEVEITDIACECCGFKTVFSSGFVILEDNENDEEQEMEYIARWTDGKGDHDVFFLVYVEDKERYASVVFSFDDNAFSIIEPVDSDWGEVESNELISRKELIDTPYADTVFQALDDIWENDKALNKFVELVMLERLPDSDDDTE